MNPITTSELSERYLTALRTHLENGAEASLHEAHELGCQAVFLGLETLDLAAIHEAALASLLASDLSMNARKDLAASAAVFFTETLTAIEETHRTAVEASADLNELHSTLGQLTLDLADSNRELQQGITDRKEAEAALEAGAENSRRLLKESRILETHLQDMVRKILSVNEEERRQMSLQLNDEIAQTMLGIHVRLLALQKATSDSEESHSKEISIIQRLVEKSVKTINSFTREFDTPKQR
ncbi:MAG: phosphatase RsbU N-terminal domain-containing protein [Prosthecobacter sp.]